MSSLICSSLTPMDEIVYGNRVSLSVLVEVESMQGGAWRCHTKFV